jgi:hypothetical protein
MTEPDLDELVFFVSLNKTSRLHSKEGVRAQVRMERKNICQPQLYRFPTTSFGACTTECKAWTIIQESVSLEKGCPGCVVGVCIINKLLKIFQLHLGSKRRAPQIIEEVIKAVGSEVNDYIVLVG